MKRASALIIPALNPGYEFISYVKSLISNDFKRIIIINDGSSSDQEPIFQELSSFPECSVLTHAVNMGKGRALKDAFNYYLCTYSSDFCGVITADSDGQHTVEDVIRIDNALIQDPTRLIWGVRNFDDSSVPFKSSFGNKLTRITIKALWGGANHRHTNWFERDSQSTYF